MLLDEQLKHLPGDILLALALNESADPRGRKAAVDIMYTKDYPQAQHKDLAGILAEVKADHEAKHEIMEVVEQALEEPQPSTKPIGASVAGVTTKTLNG